MPTTASIVSSVRLGVGERGHFFEKERVKNFTGLGIEIFVFEISSENIISNVCSCILMRMRMLFNVCEACRRVDKALSLYNLLVFFCLKSAVLLKWNVTP